MTAPAPELQLLGEIAQGGMGYVELGRLRDESGERLVAVKRMHPEYARDPEFVRMFKDEIFLTGAVQHPTVVGLIGWGEDQDGPYLLMEYVEGVAFGDAFERGRAAEDPIVPELVVWVAARVAEGLHMAHSKQDEQGRPLEIVHRDITPSNILIGFDGGVKITDFGIAKASIRSSHTRTGIIKGKISYMSPEYAARRIADGRSDLYSLGIVMFEALAGDVPFHARGDLELLKLVAYAVVPSLASVAPHTDRTLVAIVDRLLSKDPEARFADGAVLQRELDAWCQARGFDDEQARTALAEYVRRYGSGRRETLRRLSDESALTRALDTATFTFFDTEITNKKPNVAQPKPARATRKLSASEAPPAPVLENLPKMPAAPALPTFGAADGAPRPRAERSLRPLLIIASAFGLVGIAVSIALAIPSGDPEPASAEPLPPPPPPEIVTVAPTLTPIPVVPKVLPVTKAAPTASETVAPAKKPPRAGPRRPVPSIVSGPKQSSPCTPDRFDYPACLNPR